MNEYRPDNWVVLKIRTVKKSGNTGYGRKDHYIYKVLAGWSGSYLNGDAWRLNSGITLVFDREDEVHFHGESGSVYRCPKGQYLMRMNTIHIYNELKDKFGDDIELMDEKTDWTKI